MCKANATLLVLLLSPFVMVSDFSWASPELPELLPVSEEVAIAERAGPTNVSKNATIYVLKRGGFEVARKGTNGFACLVTRSDEGSFEPQCFDPEGVATILPVAIERAGLIENGMSRNEADAVIALGFAEGRFRVPRLGGVIYMLSTANRVFNGEKVISYPPHVMITAPYVTNKDIGADFSDPHLPWVLDEGKPTAYIMVITNNQSEKE